MIMSEAIDGRVAAMQTQQHIRENASELQDYFSDLYAWEKKIQQQEQTRNVTRSNQSSDAPDPRMHAKVDLAIGTRDNSARKDAKRADAHTYDRGYQRWEKFDVEEALREDGKPSTKVSSKTTPVSKPKAATTGKSRGEIEREDGNNHYKQGDYIAAIKCYTRAIGYDASNPLILSNRAMAYLKTREYAKAEEDCTRALSLDSTHTKSYTRRGTARNALGKHRLALADFQQAASLDPKSKQIQSQLATTRDQMKTAIKRAPKHTDIPIAIVESSAKEVEYEHPIERQQEANAEEEEIEKVEEEISEPSVASSAAPILPQLPSKAPSTSYEFTRVWKSLVPRGDAEHLSQLLSLRSRYLQMIQPSALPRIFKSSIEESVLLDIFHVLRLELDAERITSSYAADVARSLTQVPRFNMTVMFLSKKQKEDMETVLHHLQTSETSDEATSSLAKAYDINLK